MPLPSYKYSGTVYTGIPLGTLRFPMTTVNGAAIPFLEAAHVHVLTTLDKGATTQELQRPTEWDFNAARTEIVLASQLPGSTDLIIERRTPSDYPYVVFAEGTLLTAEQLNELERWALYVIQELSDLQARGVFAFPGQIINSLQQKAGNWISDDLHVPTTGAASERFDVYVQDSKPPDPPITEQRQPGKLWVDTAMLQISWWSPDAKAWVNVSGTGPAGRAATISIGSTTTGAAGSAAAVTNSGTDSAAVFDFVLPQGPQGLPGSTGPAGPPGGALTHIGEPPITVTTAGSVVTHGFNVTPLPTLP